MTAAIFALDCLTTVPLESIRVTARNSLLHLDGTVTSSHQRITLEEVARNVPGVRGVVDRIEVAWQTSTCGLPRVREVEPKVIHLG